MFSASALLLKTQWCISSWIRRSRVAQGQSEAVQVRLELPLPQLEDCCSNPLHRHALPRFLSGHDRQDRLQPGTVEEVDVLDL